MSFIKLVKNKAYFKRFQTKYRRRREGKTDYHARLKLVTQCKNKYHAPKYRVVVRFTNKDIVAQVVYATVTGDKILSYAYSHELPRYGIKYGLTNWSAAYATGLLLARRTLKILSLDSLYSGAEEVNGKDYNVEDLSDGPRAFSANLDIGLKPSTTGSRIFGVMKGACDGGMNIPHSETRIVGYNIMDKSLDAEVLRKYIYGGQVAEYMEYLQEEDEESYERQFAKYIKGELSPDNLESMYSEAHAAIRANPEPQKSKKEHSKHSKKYRKGKMNLLQRKDRVKQKIASFKTKLAKSAEELE